MHVEATSAGLLAIGVGSLLAVLPRLIRPNRPRLGLAWESLASPIERLHFSVETVGSAFVAIGSAVVAINALRPWWLVVLVVLAACAGIWTVAAAKRRQLWTMRAEQATAYAQMGRPVMSADEVDAVARRNARWSACLVQPFASAQPWPPAAAAAADGRTRLEPGHIEALREQDARLEDAHIPPEIRFDVANLRAQRFTVRVVGDSVIAQAPDGRTAQISRSSVASRSVGQVVHRMRWLDELEQIGARIQPAAQGKRYVASSDYEPEQSGA